MIRALIIATTLAACTQAHATDIEHCNQMGEWTHHVAELRDDGAPLQEWESSFARYEQSPGAERLQSIVSFIYESGADPEDARQYIKTLCIVESW